ncbi:MAG: hypothetical protein ACRD2U_12795 [Terriglobales bacterium]
MQSPSHCLMPLLITLFLAASSSFLHAQKLPTEIDAYGGFSHASFDSTTLGFSSKSSLNGFAASITAPHLYEELGFTINADGGYASPLKVYNFLIGPQFSFETGRLRLFGNILGGKAETKIAIHQPTRNEITSVGRAIALGGGLDINLAHHIAVRVIDADYVYSKTFNANQNYVRLSAGFVYQFGRK